MRSTRSRNAKRPNNLISSIQNDSKNKYDGKENDENDDENNAIESEQSESVQSESVQSESEESEEEKMKTSRRSTRSNKFTSSMKEPTESVADLFGGRNKDRVPARDGKRSKTSNNNNNSKKRKVSNADVFDDSSNDESQDGIVSRRKTVRKKSLTRSETKKLKAVSPITKSPAVRHSKARRQMKLKVSEDDDSEANISDESLSDDEGDASEEEEDEEENELKIQRIIATRSNSRRQWREICKGMDTSEVENGSRWFQSEEERDVMDEESRKRLDDRFQDRFLVKWTDLSFLHCSWETKEDLMDQVEGTKASLRMFFKKSVDGFLYDAEDRLDGEFFDPGYVQIDRILEINLPESMQGRNKRRLNDSEEDWQIIFDKSHPDYDSELGRQFLIKWVNTPYSEATYEYERDLIMREVEYLSHIEDFLSRSKKVSKAVMKKNFQLEDEARRRLYKMFGDRIRDSEEKNAQIDAYKKQLEEMTFKNGGQLRDYQAEGVSWLLANHINRRSAILADEMGLGKTIQTAAYVHMVESALCCRGPFLIVAPLSTIPHWHREFDGWTGLNTIIYHGSAQDREVMREYEFAFECDRPKTVRPNQKYLKICHNRSASRAEKIWMAQVVITTPEMLLSDTELMEIKWEILVVDEAHRLKNHNSKLALLLRSDEFSFKHSLLLTGTPIQNNMNELWTLMNFVDSSQFEDCNEFMELYGDMKSKESVDGLHDVIRPYILRRLKEDVEKSVPPKEETIIEVELTLVQKQYYRALYEKNVQFLHKDVKKALDGPSLNNLDMQLRKCCNHPFLLNGVEEKIKEGKEHKTREEEAEFLVKSSGKLVLLDKLLPRLKQNGHRILIFSQFTIMLDILEDYLDLREFRFERIDGNITGKKRQMAIDRFQGQIKSSTESPFIMLLTTRAGGVGINLTAADTCIIFDSDWNPQNDLQAQARCHRIGQTKSVKVYRLLTRKTHEMQIFHVSSLKMGLDQAVLQGIENGSGNDQDLTKEEVEKLLRCGAYDIFREEKAGISEKESNEFIEQDIDSILARRSKTVIHENTGSKSNAAGGTFSKASFTAKAESATPGKDVDIDDPDFWTKMVGAPIVDDESVSISGKKKRKRTHANYNEKMMQKDLDEHIIINYGYSASDLDDDSYNLADDDDPGNFDQACEYNLNSELPLKNKALQELLTAKKKQISCSERRRWGGKGTNDWTQSHVETLMDLLLKYGYCKDKKWIALLEQFRKVCKKKYDEQEVKRMCWSLCLFTLVESAILEVREMAKRKQKAAEKKKEESPSDSVIPQCDDVDSKEWQEKQTDISFKKLWEEYKWLHEAFDDAILFAKTNKPHDKCLLAEDIFDESTQPTPLFDAFVENVLPALQNRGWQEQMDGERRSWISPSKSEFHFVDEILDQLPTIHSELSSTVDTVIAGVLATQRSAEAESTNNSLCEENKLSTNTAEVNINSIQTLLEKHAPLQLVADRRKPRIDLKRKKLEVIMYIRNANYLSTHVDSMPNSNSLNYEEKCVKMSKLLNLHYKGAIPHPLWKPIHDAVLVSAIAKHGWLESGNNFPDIMEDIDIKWGTPFDEGKFSKESNEETNAKSSESITLDQVLEVAERAVAFLNSQKEIKEFKGFNVNLVSKSYGIVSCEEKNDAGQVKTSWKVEENLVKDIIEERLNNGRPKKVVFEELPPRRDLVRRAKTILSNAHEIQALREEANSNENEFVTLDQGNVLNIFLAELLREVLKQSQRGMRIQREALESATKEARHLLDAIPEGKDQDDFEKLCGHIDWINRNRSKISRPVKNVLRFILALGLIPPVNPDDKMFPTEINQCSLSNRIQPKSLKKGNESAVGDLAINKAITVAKQKVKSNNAHDVKDLLGITTIETLILSVMCSQGIPIWTDDWEYALTNGEELEGGDEFLISWFHMGNVLEVAAEKWVEISQLRLQKAERAGSDKIQFEKELESRLSAHEEAMRLHQKPIYLAKKTIMLIEALRLHMGSDSKYKSKSGVKPENGLGARIFLWSKSHLSKWAKALGIFADGHTISATVMGIRPESTANGFLDKKNCKAIFTQISQQTRLRSLYVRYERDEMFSMVSKAVKNMKRNGDTWKGQPSWWKSNAQTSYDFELLAGVLQFGYGGFEQMIQDIECFSDNSENRAANDRLCRSSVQQRVNSITRELSGMDDGAETMRLMNERKNKISQQNENRSSNGHSTIQVGIDAFFKASDATVKDEVTNDSSNVTLTVDDSDNDSEIAVIAVISPKRKSQDNSTGNVEVIEERQN